MDAINTYMDSINLPYVQRIKVREFYELSLDLYRNKHYQHLLRFLSPALRGMVAAHMHESWITQISFFQAPTDEEMSEFVTAISMALQPVAFSPMEVVLKVGYRNSRMFII